MKMFNLHASAANDFFRFNRQCVKFSKDDLGLLFLLLRRSCITFTDKRMYNLKEKAEH